MEEGIGLQQSGKTHLKCLIASVEVLGNETLTCHLMPLPASFTVSVE